MKRFLFLVLGLVCGCSEARTLAPKPQPREFLIAPDSVQYEYQWQPDSFTYYRERWLYATTANALVTLTPATDSSGEFRLTGTLAGLFSICDIATDSVAVGEADCSRFPQNKELFFLKGANLVGTYVARADSFVVAGPDFYWVASGGLYQTVWTVTPLTLAVTINLAQPGMSLRMRLVWVE